MLFVELQLFILVVDPVLGSDGTIHKTLTPSLCLNYLALAICAAHTVVYQVSTSDLRPTDKVEIAACLNTMCCMYCMIVPFVPYKAYNNGPMHRDNY